MTGRTAGQLGANYPWTLEKRAFILPILFLVLPHPEVLTYMRRKTNDYDRWLGGMRRLNDKFEDAYRKREESQD